MVWVAWVCRWCGLCGLCGCVGSKGGMGVGEWRGFQNADTDEQTDGQIYIPPLVQTK